MAKLVRALIREDRLTDVVNALEQEGVDGITLTMARGCGRHAATASFRGYPYRVLLPIAVLEVIAADATAETLTRIIVDRAHTGHKGDGHVLILDVDQHVSVRTRWLDVA